MALDARAAMEEVEAHLQTVVGTKRFQSMAQIPRLDWGPYLGSEEGEVEE